jgi:hypothetical protein
MNRLCTSLAVAAIVAGRAPVAPAFPGDAEPLLPRVEMPDKVYETLSAAIASYADEKLEARQLEELKQKNASALARMRKLPWPDFKKLQLMRLTDAKQADFSITAWCVPRNWGGRIVLSPDFTATLVRDFYIGKAVPRSYDEALGELLASLGKPRPQGEQRTDLHATLDFCYPTPYDLLDHAYEAAFLGKDEAARKLMHAALDKRSPYPGWAYVDWAYREWARRSYDRAFFMLAAGDPREEVLAHWQATLKLYDESPYVDALRELVRELEKQVAAERRLAATQAGAPERLPVEKRADYYVARLCDARGQFPHPNELDASHGMAVDLGTLDGLVKIGRPAVPGLIEHLADRGPTRVVVWGRDFWFRERSMRVQDLALRAIEQILGTQFYHPSAKDRLFSEEPETLRTKVGDEIRAWCKKLGERPAGEGLRPRLDTAPVA